MSLKMTALQKVLPPEVRLISFTVDPDYDTPEVLQAYAKRFGADPGRWIFVRGDKEALHKLLYAGFRLALAENRAAPPGFSWHTALGLCWWMRRGLSVVFTTAPRPLLSKPFDRRPDHSPL